MKLFIDTANIDEIREVHSWGILDGCTTNPSLIAKEGRDFIEVIHEICELVQGPVSAETLAQDPDGMVKEGLLLAQVHEHVVIKVPCTPAGLAATSRLAAKGIRVNVTLCFNSSQALFAAKAGAAYISPFLGRVDDISWRGMDLIEEIVAIYANDPQITTEILSASIRHPMHLTEAAMAGSDVATMPYKVFKQGMGHPLTDIGNARFLKDWEGVPEKDVAALAQRWLDKNR